MVYREKHSLNPLGKPLPPKEAHRGAATVRVSQGNHSVEGIGTLNRVEGLIEILHFPVRSFRQIENKISLGGAAYARNRELHESVGVTWRKLYEDYRSQGNLNRYFDEQYNDARRLEARLNAGEILVDTRLRDFFSAG